MPGSSEDLAYSPSSGLDNEWLVQAALESSDYGMLVTTRDRRVIAVNRRFGEFYDVDFRNAIELGIDGLQEIIFSRVKRAHEWKARTDVVVEDPNLKFHDHVEIDYKGRRTVLDRSSAPIHDGNGNAVGRIWTYRDITREVRQREINEILIRLSSEFVFDPAESLRRVLRVLTAVYPGTSSILSLREGDCMRFLAVESSNPLLKDGGTNAVEDSFCQFALELLKPLIIQDARQVPKFANVPAIQFGMTRYLGVPLYGGSPEPIGTLCILDGFSEKLLDDLDLNFLTLLGLRVSGELMRQQYTEERVAEHKAQAHRQKAELVVTHEVLDAMKEGFELVWSVKDLAAVMKAQGLLLANLMGHTGAAVALRRPRERIYRGFAVDADRSPKKVEVAAEALSREASGHIVNAKRGSLLCQTLLSESVCYGIRSEEGVGDVLVAFCGVGELLNQSLVSLLRSSLVDQVSLMLGTHVLLSDLETTQGQLGQMQQTLVEREKLAVVGTLAAGTAHDIRNILSSLSLLLSPSGGLSDSGLVAVREQIGRFDLLAHRLLSYAKPRMVAQSAVDMCGLLDNVLALTAGQFRVGKVKAIRRFQAGLPPVAGDPHEYEQVFVNLFLNGVQSMGSQGGTLRLKAHAEGDSVVVKISDNGSGIAPEMRSRLFEPFASTRSDGFGLGLFSCKRIVEHHGGRISVRRNARAGTTFTVSLPVLRA